MARCVTARLGRSCGVREMPVRSRAAELSSDGSRARPVHGAAPDGSTEPRPPGPRSRARPVHGAAPARSTEPRLPGPRSRACPVHGAAPARSTEPRPPGPRSRARPVHGAAPARSTEPRLPGPRSRACPVHGAAPARSTEPRPPGPRSDARWVRSRGGAGAEPGRQCGSPLRRETVTDRRMRCEPSGEPCKKMWINEPEHGTAETSDKWTPSQAILEVLDSRPGLSCIIYFF